MKVSKTPRVVAKIARATNQNQQGLQAGKGVQITKSKSRTIVKAKGGSSSGSEGAAIEVVGSDGLLNKVPKHSTWSSPGSYPTTLRCGDPGFSYTAIGYTGLETVQVPSGDYVTLDHVNGIEVSFSTAFCAIGANGVEINVLSLAAGTKVLRVNCGSADIYVRADGKVVVDNGSASLVIDPSSITHDMGVKQVAVCNSGTPGSMLVLGSDPF